MDVKLAICISNMAQCIHQVAFVILYHLQKRNLAWSLAIAFYVVRIHKSVLLLMASSTSFKLAVVLSVDGMYASLVLFLSHWWYSILYLSSTWQQQSLHKPNEHSGGALIFLQVGHCMNFLLVPLLVVGGAGRVTFGCGCDGRVSTQSTTSSLLPPSLLSLLFLKSSNSDTMSMACVMLALSG
jgi:hypothetical protein